MQLYRNFKALWEKAGFFFLFFFFSFDEFGSLKFCFKDRILEVCHHVALPLLFSFAACHSAGLMSFPEEAPVTAADRCVSFLTQLVAQSCLTLHHPMGCTFQAPLWNSPGKNTGVGCHSFLQGMFLSQELSPGLRIAGRLFTI